MKKKPKKDRQPSQEFSDLRRALGFARKVVHTADRLGPPRNIVARRRVRPSKAFRKVSGGEAIGKKVRQTPLSWVRGGDVSQKFGKSSLTISVAPGTRLLVPKGPYRLGKRRPGCDAETEGIRKAKRRRSLAGVTESSQSDDGHLSGVAALGRPPTEKEEALW